MVCQSGKSLVPFLAAVCALVIVAAGCSDYSEKGEIEERVYAEVNGVGLTESELRALVPPEFYDRLTPSHKKDIVRQWVDEELLYQEALRLGIDKEPKIARILEKSKRDLLSAEIIERRIAEIEPPTEEQLRRYYEENSDYFILQGNEYEVRYASFDNRNDARRFYDKVKKGASFSELAKAESKDPSARNGGSLGIVNEHSVEQAVWDEIVNTYNRRGLRKISDPFTVSDGFGIVIVDKVYEAGTIKPFESVREQVLDYYMMEKREEAKRSFLRQLAAKAEIRYNF